MFDEHGRLKLPRSIHAYDRPDHAGVTGRPAAPTAGAQGKPGAVLDRSKKPQQSRPGTAGDTAPVGGAGNGRPATSIGSNDINGINGIAGLQKLIRDANVPRTSTTGTGSAPSDTTAPADSTPAGTGSSAPASAGNAAPTGTTNDAARPANNATNSGTPGGIATINGKPAAGSMTGGNADQNKPIEINTDNGQPVTDDGRPLGKAAGRSHVTRPYGPGVRHVRRVHVARPRGRSAAVRGIRSGVARGIRTHAARVRPSSASRWLDTGGESGWTLPADETDQAGQGDDGDADGDANGTAPAAVSADGAAPATAAAPNDAMRTTGAPGNGPTVLTLTNASGKGPARSATLRCYPAGGSHPKAVQACADAAKTGGTFADLPAPKNPQACFMIYAPVTVKVRGTWQGRSVQFAAQYPNSCVMRAKTGAIFDF